MTLRRRTLFAAAAGVAVNAAVDAAFAQTPHVHHHPDLPVLAPSAEPYARLQGGQPHHLTADQSAQRSTQSPARCARPRGLRGLSKPDSCGRRALQHL